jgi:putative phage-type endonuclease
MENITICETHDNHITTQLNEIRIVPSVTTLKKRVTYLKKRPQPEQRTAEWYAQRQTKVTASEAASCLSLKDYVINPYIKLFDVTDMKSSETKCANPYQSKDAYILKKCEDFFSETKGNYKDNKFTLWGKKYEEIANRLYCILKNKEVHEFGLINHSKLKWLAASPDGITNDGVMIEIKCPLSRKITATPPFYYWIQVQIQLEVCNLYQCDFVQCEIIELETEEDYINHECKDKGILLEITSESGGKTYQYPPNVYLSVEDFQNWAAIAVDKHLQEHPSDEMKKIYYVIHNYNIIEIPRDIQWFESVKKDIKECWDRIVTYQKDRQIFQEFKELYESKKRKVVEKDTTIKICLLDD